MDEIKDVNYWLSKGDKFYEAKDYEAAIKCYEEAIKLDPENADAFCAWGDTLCHLALIKQDKSLLQKIEIFENVSKKITNFNVFFNKGELYFILKQGEKAREYFIKSKKSILEILTFLEKDNREKIVKTEFLYPLLELNNDDSIFFKEIINGLTQEQKKNDLNKYKEVYILSAFIISQLHVKNENEKLVASYREKNIVEKMLIGNEEVNEEQNENSKFRLNAINYSNDPTEGMTLLNYLFGKECPKRERLNTEYGAFAGCFIFNYDSLNQFRLYGKKDGKEEGTGLSVVFKSNFFSDKVKIQNSITRMEDNTRSEKEDKFSLFRCIYIDPDTGLVDSVGYKEKLVFYREGKEKEDKDEDIEEKFKDYNNYINEILKSVKDNMKELKELIKNNHLDSVVIGKLLINLRYLTKHIAFKEEQECRILEICRFDKEEEDKEKKDGKERFKIKVEDKCDPKRMYIKYQDIRKNYIEKIYFGPKATDMELFQDFLYRNGLNIPCKKSTNPLA